MTGLPFTIVALHGAGMHGGVWGGMAPMLDGMPFVALSFPAHGAAGGEALGNIPDMAAWTRKRLQDIPAQRVFLVGHSMGALAALEAAADPKVAGVVLMGAAARMPVHPDLLSLAEKDAAAAGEMILKWGVDPAHRVASEIKTFLRDLMKTQAAGVLAGDLRACDLYKAGEATAAGLEKPLLVIGGAQDKLTKAQAGAELAAGAKRGVFHILQDCGHMMMLEKPSETAELIRVFASGVQESD